LNSSDANKFLSVVVILFYKLKVELQVLTVSLSFVREIWSRTMDKLAISWQNLPQVGIQLMFVFRIGHQSYLYGR